MRFLVANMLSAFVLDAFACERSRKHTVVQLVYTFLLRFGASMLSKSDTVQRTKYR